ncbi:hypothetical protein BH11PAT2_BH11PAT2_03330 [soil metagenome]
MNLRVRELARALTLGLCEIRGGSFLFPYTFALFPTANDRMAAILVTACRYQKLN